MWRRDASYEQLITEALTPNSNTLGGLQSSRSLLRGSLQSWSRDLFGLFKGQLKALSLRLVELRVNSVHCWPTREERYTLIRISKVLAREETVMKHRSLGEVY